MQSGINHFHSGIAKRGGDDLGSAVVSVQTWLGDQYADGTGQSVVWGVGSGGAGALSQSYRLATDSQTYAFHAADGGHTIVPHITTRDGTMSFFSSMSTKDIISLVLSSAAFVISLISLRQKRFETERAIRRELSDAIDKLNKINIETAKLWEDGLTPAEQNLIAVYGQQGVSITRQALYLAEQIPKRVSDVEYGTLAQALLNLGNLAQAEGYYVKSVEQSPDEFAKALNKRVYAYFLFSIGKVERGRQTFQECLAPFDSPGDYNLYAKGGTYLRWAMAEAIFTLPKAGEKLFEAAWDAFNHISIPMQKMNALREFQNMRVELAKQQVQLQTGGQPGSAGIVLPSHPMGTAGTIPS